jgi:hypothetical protein
MPLLRKDACFEAFRHDVIEAHHGHSTRIVSYCVWSNGGDDAIFA